MKDTLNLTTVYFVYNDFDYSIFSFSTFLQLHFIYILYYFLVSSAWSCWSLLSAKLLEQQAK